ncbi:MAG: AAA family ATPase [Helicobacteraceae bacterium]|jgi:wobble nucleotide-excising tRNase|nr:AAA family ATPase [Helicobacteraceae bacterium]
MIESITIKNVATFDTVGIQIDDFKKVNFIYGANASGKTTISNLLHNPNDEKFVNTDCSVKWKNNLELQTLVYNKDFRERNFGNGKITGVFTIGEATAEQIKEIEEKTQQLGNIQKECIQKKTTIEAQTKEKENIENQFKETSWTKIYKKYENDFKEAFRGTLQKESFKEKLLSEFANNKTALPILDELKEKAKIIFGEQQIEITAIATPLFDRIVEIENNQIWKKIIVGKVDVDIAKLINKLNINDWVNQGKSYVQDDNICPFCQQQTITDDFRKQIESFFDETYLNDLKLLKDLKSEYDSLIQNTINELSTIEANQRVIKNTKLEIDKFSAYLKTLTSQCTTNKEYLNSKEKEPSRSFELIVTKEQFSLITALIENANKAIQKHNKIVANFQTEKYNLIESVWRYLVEEFKTEITEFNKSKNGLQTGITNLQEQQEELEKKYKKLDIETKELSKNVTSIQPTIDEINRLLESFGFLNFKIVSATENGFYQIQRDNGTIAEKTLSEGEITFITFLYYLQLAKGGISEETVNIERILVIDDPISSLDSNVLFVVSSLIKEIIKKVKADKGNIKQLIILTHNIYFHKEVSFVDGRTKQSKDTHFWILRKDDKISNIQVFKMDNPIQSSYGLLWQELKSNDAKSSITIQNVMRRIIENYFKLLGKYGDDDLIKKFQTKEEQVICKSLFHWTNDGSHNAGIGDDVYLELQENAIDKYKKVFKDIFTLTNHVGHYNMMMGIEDIIEENDYVAN